MRSCSPAAGRASSSTAAARPPTPWRTRSARRAARRSRASGTSPRNAGPAMSTYGDELPAEAVAAVVVALAHPSCPLTGELVGAAGGRVTRIQLTETRGAGSLLGTPEAVAAAWPSIVDEAGATTAGSW